MARWTFNYAKKLFLTADIDLQANTIKAMLVLSTSNINRSAVSLAAITSLIEFDGTGYSRQEITGKTFVQDDTNNLGIFKSANISFGSLGAPTQTFNLLIYQDGVDDSARIPLFFNGDSPFPRPATAQVVNLRFSATGILSLRDGA